MRVFTVTTGQIEDLLVFCELFQFCSSIFVCFLHRNVFERISAVKELASLCQSLRIFIKHFVGRPTSNNMEKGLNLVDGILGASHTTKL